MNNIKIEELMKVRFDGIANRLGHLTKGESESLLLEHLESVSYTHLRAHET